jgi:hypothetical protein
MDAEAIAINHPDPTIIDFVEKSGLVWDQRFESAFLQRRVTCELGQRATIFLPLPPQNLKKLASATDRRNVRRLFASISLNIVSADGIAILDNDLRRAL